MVGEDEVERRMNLDRAHAESSDLVVEICQHAFRRDGGIGAGHRLDGAVVSGHRAQPFVLLQCSVNNFLLELGLEVRPLGGRKIRRQPAFSRSSRQLHRKGQHRQRTRDATAREDFCELFSNAVVSDQRRTTLCNQAVAR